MRKPLSYLAAGMVLFASCTKTEIEERIVEVETIVEVPTAIDLASVSLAASTAMTNESQAQVIVISAAIANALDEAIDINLNFSGSAELNTDYTVSGKLIHIPAGELIGTTEITILSDNSFESGIENIIVSLANLSNTITPSGNGSAVQIDITDSNAIVAFSDATIIVEETSSYNLNIMMSAALNDDIVVYYEAFNPNSRYSVDGEFVIIPAGETSASISLDINDFRLTPAENLRVDITITSIENEDVQIGSTNSVAITTTEVSEGLLINASWETELDLFDLRVYDTNDNRVGSSFNSGNSDSIFIDKNAFSALEDGMYTIELDDFDFDSDSPPEVVTFEFLDELGETFNGPFTFTVNNPGDRIVTLNLELANGTYTITQSNTSN